MTETERTRLDAIEAKLDRLLDRQDVVEDFIVEMTPVAREALRVGAEQLAEYERRGWFAAGRELVTLVDGLVTTLDHADDVAPVGVLGAMRITSTDPDIQHGIGLALKLLGHLGRVHGGGTGEEAPAVARPPAAKAPRIVAAPAAAQVKPTGRTVQWQGRSFTEEGFLVDAADWDEALATQMAASLGVTLTDAHWEVIRWARNEFLTTGASPNVRRVATGSGVGTRRMYELFPKSPGKTTAMLAGVPKPVGCL